MSEAKRFGSEVAMARADIHTMREEAVIILSLHLVHGRRLVEAADVGNPTRQLIDSRGLACTRHLIQILSSAQTIFRGRHAACWDRATNRRCQRVRSGPPEESAMTLARLCFISSIPMLLVAGNPEAVNITMGLATNASMQGKEIGTSQTKSRHERFLCCGASEGFFRQITQAVSFQEFLSTKRFCLCKLIENDLADSEGCFTEAPSRFISWSSSAAFVNDAETQKTPYFRRPCTCIPAAPSSGPSPPREMKALDVRETMQQARLEKTKTQSDQFAATSNAEPGFVALLELTDGGADARSLGPPDSSDPLRQHAILFEAGLKGRVFPIDFLKGPETHAGIARHGSARPAQS